MVNFEIIENTHHYDISTALLDWSKWTSLRQPVAISIVNNPVNNALLISIRYELARLINTLESIMNILRNPKDTWSRLGDYDCCQSSSCHRYSGVIYAPYQVKSTPVSRENRISA